MSEEIGRHKGAVETLLHEKKELSRILQIVNGQLQRHLNALEEAGVDTDKFIEDLQQQGQQQKSQKERNRNRSSSSRNSRSENREQEEDTDDLLESDDDFGDRDFNPNR